MKWKIAAAATLAAVAVSSAPLAGATPSAGSGNGNANGNRGTTSIGQTISAIAKNGGGAAGVLGALVQLKPGNFGLANALQRVTAPKSTTATPTPTSTSTATSTELPTSTATVTVSPTA